MRSIISMLLKECWRSNLGGCLQGRFSAEDRVSPFHFHFQRTRLQVITYKMPSPDVDDKRKAAREVIDILHEIATLLVSNEAQSRVGAPTKQAQNTHLNRQQLSYCVSLIENGVNPEALAVSRVSAWRWNRLTRAVECHQRAPYSIPRTTRERYR